MPTATLCDVQSAEGPPKEWILYTSACPARPSGQLLIWGLHLVERDPGGYPTGKWPRVLVLYSYDPPLHFPRPCSVSHSTLHLLLTSQVGPLLLLQFHHFTSTLQGLAPLLASLPVGGGPS